MKFVEYDWFNHSDIVDDDDPFEVKQMKETKEKSDGGFIWASCEGGFVVFDTWDELERWENQN